MKDLQKKSYKDLEKQLIENRCELRKADAETGRRLVRENHEIMIEMDKRLAKAEKKLLAGRK